MRQRVPVNILPEKTLRQIQAGERKVQLIYRDKLAERLGIAPKERLSLTMVEHDDKAVDGKVLCLFSVLIDGGDLTPGQERVFQDFLNEVGVATLGFIPERPTTS
jgi:hypothetical protein